MIIDTAELIEDTPVAVEKKVDKQTTKNTKRVTKSEDADNSVINCLRNERVTVKYIPKEKTGLTDKKHPFYGGLADNATVSYTVPMMRNGSYFDPLTKNEKAFLEEYLGLNYNALSVHNKENNYWDNFIVTLSKTDTILDLSDAIDYIKYKVLLLNKDYIASSMKVLRDTPYETFRFVIVSDNELYSNTVEKTNIKSKCWKEFGKIEDNYDVLSCVIETIDGRPVAPNTRIEFLREKADKLIEADSKIFLATVTDPLLPTKVVLKKAVEKSVVERRGDYYFYNDLPLCGKNEHPTMAVAAKYLATPENQELKFSIEAKIK